LTKLAAVSENCRVSSAEALGQGVTEVEPLASFWLRWSEFDALRAQKYAHGYDQSAIAD
jgi:hypothetical protein